MKMFLFVLIHSLFFLSLSINTFILHKRSMCSLIRLIKMYKKGLIVLYFSNGSDVPNYSNMQNIFNMNLAQKTATPDLVAMQYIGVQSMIVYTVSFQPGHSQCRVLDSSKISQLSSSCIFIFFLQCFLFFFFFSFVRNLT